jgi:hypothetical protein
MVAAVSSNGANLAIWSAQTEQVFRSCGIDSSKKVAVYGELEDPIVTRVGWSIISHGHLDVALFGNRLLEVEGLGVTCYNGYLSQSRYSSFLCLGRS